MNNDTTKPAINMPQVERDQARASYAVDFDMARARQAADKDRRMAENDALNSIRPGDNFDSFPARS